MTSNIFKKSRTPVVETKPEVIAPPAPTPLERPAPVSPSALVESPPQAAPSQLDRIEDMLKRAVRRLGC